MTAINKINPETIEDYIYLSCYRKAITIEQMCSDLNIPYDLFVTNISEVVGHKLLEKIMDYLNDDSLFLLNLPLTNNKNKPLEITPSHILSPDEFKHTLFESNSERYTQFSRSVNHYARQNNIKTKILSTMDLVNIVKSFTDIIAEPFDINGTIEYRLYKRGYDKPIYYMLTSENIQYYLDDIQYALGAENSSIWRKATAVTRNLTILASLNKFPQYNPAPSYYVLASNGIFNRKTKEFYPENSTEYTELTRKYHFIANASFNYLTEPKNLEIIESYEKVIEHISGGNKKLRDKLEQQLCSVLEGYNHDGLVFITSSSRINLKVFSHVIQFLAGELLWDYANIYETKKDSDLNYINYNSKLLIAQITKDQNKLSPKAIEKCKQIFHGGSIITSKQKGYKTYFKLRIPWIQILQNPKDLKTLKHDTRDIQSVTINLSNKDIDYNFANKFINKIYYLTTPTSTEFADEIGSYLLNKTNLPSN